MAGEWWIIFRVNFFNFCKRFSNPFSRYCLFRLILAGSNHQKSVRNHLSNRLVWPILSRRYFSLKYFQNVQSLLVVAFFGGLTLFVLDVDPFFADFDVALFVFVAEFCF